MAQAKKLVVGKAGGTTVGLPPGTVVIPEELKHVVVIIQENRSFDQYFGFYPGVRGLGDPSDVGVFEQRWPASPKPAKHLYPFEMDPSKSPGAIGHSWYDLHDAWNGGKLDRWLYEHPSTTTPVPTPFATMGYYLPTSLPYHTALAANFTICDHYFSGVLSSTASNRAMLMSGSIDPEGKHGGPLTGDPGGAPDGKTRKYGWTSYPDQLHSAKIPVSFAVYEEDPSDQPGTNPWTMNLAAYFKSWPKMLNETPSISRTGATAFEDDAKSGNLPEVSWLIPPYHSSEHPDYLPVTGAYWLSRKIGAVLSNPERWNDTAILLTYDECGGCFDHVAPPAPPKNTPGEWIKSKTYTGNYASAGPGFRVPCLLISKWSTGGRVISNNYDHTSLLRCLGSMTGITPANISAWRMKTFGNLIDAFDFAHPSATPPTLPTPPDIGGNAPLPKFPQKFPPDNI
ncbi:MAG TPA: alkaline phosphatase family protein [Kofleriaceae bacterium]|nr:alkaline phosphatase family protein [Kofleriaceae bacterium]